MVLYFDHKSLKKRTTYGVPRQRKFPQQLMPLKLPLACFRKAKRMQVRLEHTDLAGASLQ